MSAGGLLPKALDVARRRARCERGRTEAKPPTFLMLSSYWLGEAIFSPTCRFRNQKTQLQTRPSVRTDSGEGRGRVGGRRSSRPEERDGVEQG